MPPRRRRWSTRQSAQLGPLGLLVNNASIFDDDSVDDLRPGGLGPPFRHPRQGAGRCWRSASPRALPAGAEGLVVNIIDQRVWRLTPRYFSYTLSKSALWTATQTMAQALAPRIRVNAIGPGPTLANERQQPSDFEAQVDGAAS